MSFRRIALLPSVLALATWVPAAASAQAFGIGPRLSFVHPEAGPATTPAARLFGGTLRMASSKHVVLEGALDYKAEFSEDGKTRIRQTPFQASLLLFPVRKAFSPYLLGGMGIYTEHTDTLGPAGVVLETQSTRKTGWHLGGGAEVFLLRHAAFFADYRFRFVKFGEPDPGAEPINLPAIPGLERLKLSHRGSMWTTGMAFYF